MAEFSHHLESSKFLNNITWKIGWLLDSQRFDDS